MDNGFLNGSSNPKTAPNWIKVEERERREYHRRLLNLSHCELDDVLQIKYFWHAK